MLATSVYSDRSSAGGTSGHHDALDSGAREEAVMKSEDT